MSYFVKFINATVLGVSIAVVLGNETALAQSVEDEVRRQTAREISNAIASLLADTVARPTVTAATDDFSGIDVWGTFIYGFIEPDSDIGLTGVGQNNSLDIEVDTYQLIAGVQKSFTDTLYAGVSLAGATSTTDISGQNDTDSDSATVTPYGAFIFHQSDTTNAWISGQIGFTFSDTDSNTAGADDSTESLGTTLSLTATHKIDAVVLEGVLGHRYSKTFIDGSSNSSNQTYFLSGKAAYTVGSWIPFFQASAEYKRTPSGASGTGFDHTSFFLQPGVEYKVDERFVIGAAVQAEVGNDALDTNIQASIKGKYRF